jgi:hypothetical protein
MRGNSLVAIGPVSAATFIIYVPKLLALNGTDELWRNPEEIDALGVAVVTGSDVACSRKMPPVTL